MPHAHYLGCARRNDAALGGQNDICGHSWLKNGRYSRRTALTAHHTRRAGGGAHRGRALLRRKITMNIFNSLGSNYTFAFAARILLAVSGSSHQKKLTEYLESRYGGKAVLTYKGREALRLAA